MNFRIGEWRYYPPTSIEVSRHKAVSTLLQALIAKISFNNTPELQRQLIHPSILSCQHGRRSKSNSNDSCSRSCFVLWSRCSLCKLISFISPIILLTHTLQLILYNLARAVYNLFLHPLSSYPGRKSWAANIIPYVRSLIKGQLCNDIHKMHLE
jgi:hypothetical protein